MSKGQVARTKVERTPGALPLLGCECGVPGFSWCHSFLAHFNIREEIRVRESGDRVTQDGPLSGSPGVF